MGANQPAVLAPAIVFSLKNNPRRAALAPFANSDECHLLVVCQADQTGALDGRGLFEYVLAIPLRCKTLRREHADGKFATVDQCAPHACMLEVTG